MIVKTPPREYEVEITEEEIEAINKCINIIRDIASVMESHHCNCLEAGYVGDPEEITTGEFTDLIDTIANAHTMFEV